MADLSPGSHANLILDPDDVVRVTASGQTTVEALYGAPAGTTSLNAQTQDFGPFGAPSKLRVTASSGRTSYEMLGALDAGAGSPVQAAGARGVGSVLSAVLGLGWAASGYQWVRVTNGVESNISGATGATYTQQSADVAAGVGVRVRVSGLSFTRDALAAAAAAVVAPPTPPALSITASFQAGTVGTAYSGSVTASGGTAPYAYALTAGTLPAGLSLNTSTGAVTGTPTTAATAGGLVFSATDSGGATASTSAQSISVAAAVVDTRPGWFAAPSTAASTGTAAFVSARTVLSGSANGGKVGTGTLTTTGSNYAWFAIANSGAVTFTDVASSFTGGFVARGSFVDANAATWYLDQSDFPGSYTAAQVAIS
jgi:large repetitive protein